MTRSCIQHGRDTTNPDFPHGKFAGWKAGCRCANCCDAKKKYFREWAVVHRAPGTEYAARQAQDKARFRQTPAGRALYRSTNGAREARKAGTKDRSKISHALMRLIYQNCPVGFQVDHILPLAKGGRHVAENLQYLPKSINLQKRDRIDLDVSGHAIRWQSLIVGTSNDYGESQYGQAAGKSGHPLGDENIVFSASKDVAVA